MAEFHPPDLSDVDRAACLVGTTIAHSSSPTFHNAIYSAIGKNWRYRLCETSNLIASMKFLQAEPKCMGIGVTMPFKVAVIPLLDGLMPDGQAIGAVNTVVFRTGEDGQRRCYGTNTDCLGIRDAFRNNVSHPSYNGKPGLVVGGGGTCRAAVYALQKFLGCSPIYIINRDKSEVDAVLQECEARGTADNLIHVQTVEQAQSLTPPAAVVSAVPNFTPQSDQEKTVREILKIFLSGPQKGPLLEMCYHPSPDTQIAALTQELGWQVIGGVEAMLGQGFAQVELWTGVTVDDNLKEVARRVIRDRTSQNHS